MLRAGRIRPLADLLAIGVLAAITVMVLLAPATAGLLEFLFGGSADYDACRQRDDLNACDRFIAEYKNYVGYDFESTTKMAACVTFAMHRRAGIYVDQEKDDLAILEYSEVIKRDPHFALAWSNRGLAWERRGYQTVARADYMAVLSIPPQNEDDRRAHATANRRLAALGPPPPVQPVEQPSEHPGSGNFLRWGPGAVDKVIPMMDGTFSMVLDGEIVKGDCAVFDAMVQTVGVAANGKNSLATKDGKRISGIRLNSPGGLIGDAACIADIVRRADLVTVVPSGATCASACFLIFAAGQKKFASRTGKVGVHGAAEQGGLETDGARSATVQMARLVKDLGVPPGIIGKMVVSPPSDMVWLSTDDLYSMGALISRP